MPRDRGFAEAVRGAARGAADRRVRVRALTTHQVAWGDAAAAALAGSGALRSAALTVEGADGATVRLFMVGKDALDDSGVALG